MNPFTIVTYGLGDPQDETSVFSLGFSTVDPDVSVFFGLSIKKIQQINLVR